MTKGGRDSTPIPGSTVDQCLLLGSRAVDAVAASILEFGFRQPIVVDEQGVIVVGHTRYKAALKLRLETAPVHVVRNLTPAQVKAYRIAKNQFSYAGGKTFASASHGRAAWSP